MKFSNIQSIAGVRVNVGAHTIGCSMGACKNVAIYQRGVKSIGIEIWMRRVRI